MLESKTTWPFVETRNVLPRSTPMHMTQQASMDHRNVMRYRSKTIANRRYHGAPFLSWQDPANQKRVEFGKTA